MRTMLRFVNVAAVITGAAIGSFGYESYKSNQENNTKYSDLSIKMGYDENDDWPEPKYVKNYDLNGILKKWNNLDDTDRETWPWIWCQRNVNQKCIVFIGISKDLKEKIAAVSGLRVNIILIVDDKKRLFENVNEQFCYESQCGILEVPVHQIDTMNNILMTSDERIIAFDECIIVNDYKP